MNRKLKVILAVFLIMLTNVNYLIHAGEIKIETGGYFIAEKEKENCIPLQCKTLKDVSYCLDPVPIFTADNIYDVNLVSHDLKDKKDIVLNIQLDKEGRDKLFKASEKYLGKRIAIIIDGILVMAPVVRTQIDSGILQLNTYHNTLEELRSYYEYLIKLKNPSISTLE